MPHQINLPAYLKRIAYQGPLETNAITLAALHASHAGAIPFENVDPQLAKPVSIELADIERKLVGQSRGGYCFEQNSLFAAVLEQLGFAVTRRLARVRWMAPVDTPAPMTHLVLVVEADGQPWLCDVGFGSIGLINPILLETRQPKSALYEPRRLVQTPEGLLHQVKLNDSWQDVYCIQDLDISPADLVLANWYTSAHPQSRFRQNLVAAIANSSQRVTLLDNQLTVRPHHGLPETRSLNSRDELVATLQQRFGIHLPPDDAARLPFRRKPA